MPNTLTHTPGPWWRDDDGFVSAGSGDTYVTVADPQASSDIDIDEREANARLIAAAPDLLALVQGFLDAHDTGVLSPVKDARALLARVAPSGARIGGAA